MSMAEDTRKRPDFSDDHSPNAPRESAPLAELARLIGQSDPFTDLSKRNPRKPFEAVRADDRPAPEWLGHPAPPAHDDYDADPAPHQAYVPPDYRGGHDEPRAHAGHADQHEDAGEYSEQQ